MSLRAFWPAPAGARPGDTYDVYRGDGDCPGTGVSLLAAGVSDLFYVDTTSAAAAQHAYKVKARRGFGSSAFSPCASAREAGWALSANDNGYAATPAVKPIAGSSSGVAYVVWANVTNAVVAGSGTTYFGNGSLSLTFSDGGATPRIGVSLHTGGGTFGIGYRGPGGVGDPVLSGWHCFIATYDNSTLKLYMDGVLLDTVSASGDASSTLITDHICLGIVNFGGAHSYNGIIDDTKFYTRPLTSPEIAAASAGQYAPFSSCSHWWPFDEGSGSTAHDAIGGYDLTLYGTPLWVAGVDLT
jgi:hypothetical protein